MQKAVSILLVFFLVAPFWITFSVLQYQQKVAKKEAKWTILRGLENEELTFLKFSREDSERILRWKHDHEFEYQGMMYDIVRSVETSDSLFYYCWADNDETLILNRIKSLLSDKNSKDENNISRLLTMFTGGLYPPDNFEFLHSDYAELNFYSPDFNFNQFAIKPSTPPPRYLFPHFA